MKSIRNHENGQAIVLLVISLVVLLGFTALAIDGGMVFSDRRLAQNIVDTAALAGGGAAGSLLVERNIIYESFTDRCDHSLEVAAEQAAIDRAGSNSDNIDISSFSAEATCIMGRPEKYILVETSLTTNTRTSFAHLLIDGPLQSTVEAETKVYPKASLFYGNSIIALSDECDPGIEVKGGGNVTNIYINGGGVFSNSCLYGNGNTTIHVSQDGGEGDGAINYSQVDGLTLIGGATFTPPPAWVDYQFPAYNIPYPPCDSLSPQVDPTIFDHPQAEITIDPGRYPSINWQRGGTLILNPGLYCITGDVNINGGKVTTNSTFSSGALPRDEERGVTFFSLTGSFYVTSNANVELYAPVICDGSVENGCPPAVQNLLIYMVNGEDVQVQGGSTAFYTGTIYAPKADIVAGGTTDSSSTYHVQLIGWNVTLNGTNQFDFTFNSDENYMIPAKMDLYR